MEPGLARVFIFPFIKKQLIIPVKELLMSLFTLAEKWLQDTPQRTYSECIHKPARALGTTNNLRRGSAVGFLPFRLSDSLFVFPPSLAQLDRSGGKPADLERAGWVVGSWTATRLVSTTLLAGWLMGSEGRQCALSPAQIICCWHRQQMEIAPCVMALPLWHGMAALTSPRPKHRIFTREEATQVMS